MFPRGVPNFQSILSKLLAKKLEFHKCKKHGIMLAPEFHS